MNYYQVDLYRSDFNDNRDMGASAEHAFHSLLSQLSIPEEKQDEIDTISFQVKEDSITYFTEE